ncbi:MAG: DMT family transporter [Lachnospiraceae bacterium]|nr:DMT family transporter [Lachnospiraceae bacterium]
MSERTKGIMYIILAAFCFSLMSLFVRLSGNIPSMQKSFFRNLVALLTAIFILRKERVLAPTDKTCWRLLLLRAFFGTIGIFCNFYAIDHLPLSDANMLNKLSPFFAVILSYFLLKENVRKYQILCVLSAFVGTLFILRPGFDNIITFPALVGLLGGMGAGTAYTFVRILSARDVKGPFIVFFFSAFSCLASLPFLLVEYTPMNGGQIGLLLLAGLAATGGQFAITAAYSHAPAREISVYDYSQILFSSLWGILLLGEWPDLLSILGYIIIFTASLLMFLKNKKAAS